MGPFLQKFNRISFLISLPVIIVGVVFSLVILRLTTSPLESYFQKKNSAQLHLASEMGMEICEENFNTLLSLRLEHDKNMIATMRNDALEQIETTDSRFIDIDLIVVEAGKLISEHPFDPLPAKRVLQELPQKTSQVIVRKIGGTSYFLYSHYFPFWRWKIVSLMSQENAFKGVIMVKRFILISLICILTVFMTTLVVIFFYLVKKPLSHITEATTQISEGHFVRVSTRRSDEVGQVVSAFNRMVDNLEVDQKTIQAAMNKLQASEAILMQSLREKEVLLKEIHHRVKNNLTIIASLLNLQQDTISTVEDAKRSLTISHNRVYSMALIHEKLYQSERFSEIDMEPYIHSLVEELYILYGLGRDIAIHIEAEHVPLTIEYAVPCGLILNELVTNALIHAFPEHWDRAEEKPTVHISLTISPDNEATVLVTDNGTGFEDSSEKTEEGTLGLQLVTILSNQVNGEFLMIKDSGTLCQVRFPVDSKKAAAHSH